MRTLNTKAEERRAVEDVLPWYAAGTLDRRSAERVERALANDRDLAQRFERVREELAQTIHLNESLGAPSERARAKLFAAIDAEEATQRQTGVAHALRTRVIEFFSAFGPRTLAYASAAALAVMVLQAGVIGHFVLKGDYGTVSEPERTIVVPAGSIDLFVTLVPQATAGEVKDFLDAHKAKIIEGPLAGATYRVRFERSGAAADDVARLLAEIGQSRRIVQSAIPAGN